MSDLTAEVARLRGVLDAIAHSWSNDPDFLRNMAAEAIFHEDQSLNDTLTRLNALKNDASAHISSVSIDTAISILKSLNPKYEMPHCHPHGANGGLTMTWHRDDTTIMLIIEDSEIDFRTMSGQKTAVRIHNLTYSGLLSQEVLRYIPLSI